MELALEWLKLEAVRGRVFNDGFSKCWNLRKAHLEGPIVNKRPIQGRWISMHIHGRIREHFVYDSGQHNAEDRLRLDTALCETTGDLDWFPCIRRDLDKYLRRALRPLAGDRQRQSWDRRHETIKSVSPPDRSKSVFEVQAEQGPVRPVGCGSPHLANHMFGAASNSMLSGANSCADLLLRAENAHSHRKLEQSLSAEDWSHCQLTSILPEGTGYRRCPQCCQPWSDGASCPNVGPSLQDLVSGGIRSQAQDVRVAVSARAWSCSRFQHVELAAYLPRCRSQPLVVLDGLC